MVGAPQTHQTNQTIQTNQTHEMKILILTPIPVEHEAVIAHLKDTTEEIVEGSRYVKGTFTGRHHAFEVVTQKTGSGDTSIALATQKAVRRFNPVAVLLVGVAGGIKDVNIGDVVVGTKFYGYEHALETDEGPKARPRSGYYSKHLKALAESVCARKDWWKRLPGDQVPNVEFGAIASGNKVVAGTASTVYQYLKTTYNDTLAIEMEAAGFGEAMSDYQTIPAINIRGISDLIDGKKQAEAAGSQPLAAAHAAAFAFELVSQLNPLELLPLEPEVRSQLDDFVQLLKKAQTPLLPENREYAPPPNMAPRELEHLKPLTQEDQAYIIEALEQAGNGEASRKLRVKLDSLFDFQQLGLTALGLPAIERYKRLEAAKADKRVVILKDYRSNSNDVRDRRVEAFHINADLDMLQAFDVDIEDTRHFRLSRIRRVEATNEPWRFESRHVMKHTDAFRIADNQMVRVQLRMDVRAYNLLLEAFPKAKDAVSEDADPNIYHFWGEVNHRFIGLLDFIMANARHVEVLGPEALKKRIREEAEWVLRKMGE